MKYLSLFSGLGGFELGIQKAYVDTTNGKKNGRSKKTSENGNSERHKKSESFDAERRQSRKYDNGRCDGQEPITCVGYSEIDRYAIDIYKRKFPEHKNY